MYDSEEQVYFPIFIDNHLISSEYGVWNIFSSYEGVFAKSRVQKNVKPSSGTHFFYS